jgi:hypothetical protein
MKKIFYSILAMSVFAGSTSCQKKVDIEKEKEAIIAVIEEQTHANIDGDFDRLSNTFVKDENTIRMSSMKAGYTFREGWDIIGPVYEEWLKERWSDYTNRKHEKTNYRIKVYPNSAWAVFDEKIERDYKGEHQEFQSIGVRFLEKVNGEWKIVFLSQVRISSYEEEEDKDDDEN